MTAARKGTESGLQAALAPLYPPRARSPFDSPQGERMGQAAHKGRPAHAPLPVGATTRVALGERGDKATRPLCHPPVAKSERTCYSDFMDARMLPPAALLALALAPFALAIRPFALRELEGRAPSACPTASHPRPKLSQFASQIVPCTRIVVPRPSPPHAYVGRNGTIRDGKKGALFHQATLVTPAPSPLFPRPTFVIPAKGDLCVNPPLTATGLLSDHRPAVIEARFPLSRE